MDIVNYKIKKILVPFDFSTQALNALKVADKFAVEFNAKIHLLNIIEPFISHEAPRFNSGQFINVARYKLEAINVLETRILKDLINPEAYTYQTCFGFYNSSVINEVKNQEYDLIILPDNTTNLFTRLFSKYKPLKIMQQTNLPVIAVNQFYRKVDFRNIILPIRNVSNWYEKVPFMVSLVKQTAGKIHPVGLSEGKPTSDPEFNYVFEKAVSILESEKVLGYVKKIKSENYVDELAFYSESLEAGLVAITPTKQQSVIKSLLQPSIYSKFIARSPAPIFGVQLS